MEQKYKWKGISKSVMIKKICKKYLKMCNDLGSDKNIEETIAGLELVKSLES
jgi:hypothetical protein